MHQEFSLPSTGIYNLWQTNQPRVSNLYVNLSNSNATPTSPTAGDLPQQPANHLILLLTYAFQNAIQMNDIHELKDIKNLYILTMKTRLTTMNILSSRLPPPVNIIDLLVDPKSSKPDP